MTSRNLLSRRDHWLGPGAETLTGMPARGLVLSAEPLDVLPALFLHTVRRNVAPGIRS